MRNHILKYVVNHLVANHLKYEQIREYFANKERLGVSLNQIQWAHTQPHATL
jgi:thiamine monophosphate synthase